MTKVLIRKKIDSEETLGTFITCKQYTDLVVTDDCDLYAQDTFNPKLTDESNVIFRYRKNVFSHEERRLCYHGLREAATEFEVTVSIPFLIFRALLV